MSVAGGAKQAWTQRKGKGLSAALQSVRDVLRKDGIVFSDEDEEGEEEPEDEEEQRLDPAAQQQRDWQWAMWEDEAHAKGLRGSGPLNATARSSSSSSSSSSVRRQQWGSGKEITQPATDKLVLRMPPKRAAIPQAACDTPVAQQQAIGAARLRLAMKSSARGCATLSEGAAVAVQAALRAFAARRRVTLARSESAAVLVQALGRGWKARHAAAAAAGRRGAAARLQATYRGSSERARFASARRATTASQAAFRGKRDRRQQRRRVGAANAIQAVVRGQNGRSVARSERRSVRAAARLQASYRGSSERARFASARHATTASQAAFRGKRERRRQRKRVGAASSIQAVVRGRSGRSVARSESAAVVLQAIGRGWRARGSRRRYREAENHTGNAAARLQAAYRGSSERVRFATARRATTASQAAFRGKRERRQQRRRIGAAVSIQAAMRSRRQREKGDQGAIPADARAAMLSPRPARSVQNAGKDAEEEGECESVEYAEDTHASSPREKDDAGRFSESVAVEDTTRLGHSGVAAAGPRPLPRRCSNCMHEQPFGQYCENCGRRIMMVSLGGGGLRPQGPTVPPRLDSSSAGINANIDPHAFGKVPMRPRRPRDVMVAAVAVAGAVTPDDMRRDRGRHRKRERPRPFARGMSLESPRARARNRRAIRGPAAVAPLPPPSVLGRPPVDSRGRLGLLHVSTKTRPPHRHHHPLRARSAPSSISPVHGGRRRGRRRGGQRDQQIPLHGVEKRGETRIERVLHRIMRGADEAEERRRGMGMRSTNTRMGLPPMLRPAPAFDIR